VAFSTTTSKTAWRSNVVWLIVYRRQFSGDTDEIGYLSAAWDDTQGLRQDGLRGLWWAYLSHIGFGPLVPVVTVPLQLLTHRGLGASVGIELVFLLILLAAAAVLGHRLGGAITAALSAVAVVGMPAIIDFSRSYQFVMGTTAMYTAAVAVLLMSAHLRRTRWAIAWGALLGLTLLARTMTVALVPGAGVDGPEQRVDTWPVDVVVYERDVDRMASCLLYTSPSPRDLSTSRMPSSA